MANLTIKDLPAPVHRELKKMALAEGKSLNGYVVSLLEMSVQERLRRRFMRGSWKAFERFRASLPYLGDSTRLIREDRDRGH